MRPKAGGAAGRGIGASFPSARWVRAVGRVAARLGAAKVNLRAVDVTGPVDNLVELAIVADDVEEAREAIGEWSRIWIERRRATQRAKSLDDRDFLSKGEGADAGPRTGVPLAANGR